MSIEQDMVTALAAQAGAGGTPVFRAVGLVGDHVAAMSGVKPQTVPAAYVVLDSIEAADNDTMGGVHQWLTETFSVWVCVGSSDQSGSSAWMALRQALSAVERALLGLRSPGYGPMVRGGESRLVGYDNAYLWWVEYYAAPRQVTTVGL